MENINKKTYNEVLQEANDFFASQGVSIVGEGYKEIATNAALFESYVDQLTEGANADSAASMAQIMANTNAGILRESSMTGIQPIASLSMPVIRKLWPKFALKDAIKTEVAKTPRFVVTYTAPYMFKGDGQGANRVDLPRGLKNDSSIANDIPEALRKEFTAAHALQLAAGGAAVVDFRYENSTEADFDAATNGSEDPKVVIRDTPSAAKVQPLDELNFVAFVIGDQVANDAFEADQKYLVWDAVAGAPYWMKAMVGQDILDGLDAGTIDAGVKAYALVEEVRIGKRLGVYGNGVYNFNGGQLLVQFDGKNDRATFAAIGGAVMISTYAAVSSEYNEESWSVGFDIKRQDIDIPTGQHINAPLPIEALNDMMALYQIDGTKETVDLMTNIFAQRLDLEVLDFLKTSHLRQQQNEAFQDGTYKGVDEFTFLFDCKPAAGFAGSPKAWREEIKPLIDHLAQKIKNQTYLQAGVFTIVGNPLDIQILANVDWQFRGGQGGNMDGVDVDYSIGTYVGANAYKVIASTNVPAGQLFIVFTPSADTQMTYKYFPYTFSTEMGYTDPNRSRVPSIMMTKRHTMHAFLDAIGCIVITNNDGKGYFAQYSNWKNVD